MTGRLGQFAWDDPNERLRSLASASVGISDHVRSIVRREHELAEMLKVVDQRGELMRLAREWAQSSLLTVPGNFGLGDSIARQAVAALTTAVPTIMLEGVSGPACEEILRELVESEVDTVRRRCFGPWPSQEIRSIVGQAAQIIAADASWTNGWTIRNQLQDVLDRVTLTRSEFTSDYLARFLNGRFPEDPSTGEPTADGIETSERSGAELVPDGEPQDERPPARVAIIRVAPELIRRLAECPERLVDLTPEQFELLIADRLDDMGFEPKLTGSTHQRDGGIDIIARPRQFRGFGLLIGVQCEHHRAEHRRTGRPKLGSLLRWKGSHLQLGVVVTNTDFTADARFEAEQPHNRGFLRLRNFGDVVRWIRGNYSEAIEWRELPSEIQLAPGIVIPLPK